MRDKKNHSSNALRKFVSFALPSACAALLLLDAMSASAQVFNGGGIRWGINQLGGGLGGISSQTSIVQLVLSVLAIVLDFVLLVAVIGIIVAGIRLIVSGGEEGEKDKAKKSIIYIMVGLIIIILARLIVLFINRLIV